MGHSMVSAAGPADSFGFWHGWDWQPWRSWILLAPPTVPMTGCCARRQTTRSSESTNKQKERF